MPSTMQHSMVNTSASSEDAPEMPTIDVDHLGGKSRYGQAAGNHARNAARNTNGNTAASARIQRVENALGDRNRRQCRPPPSQRCRTYWSFRRPLSFRGT